MRFLLLRLGTLLSLAAPALASFQQPLGPPAADESSEPRGLVHATDAAFQGYTLLAPLRSRTTFLLDMEGQVVHRWEHERTPGNAVYLLDDGTLLRCERKGDNLVFKGGGEGGAVVLLDWDGELLWELDWSNEEHLHHHDIAPLPNGNVILISWEHKTTGQAIAVGRDPFQVEERGLWPDTLIEIRPMPPDGYEVIWEWHAWDHIIQDYDASKSNYGDVTTHPELIDINADHRSDPPVSAAQRKQQKELAERMRAIGYTGDDEEDEEELDGLRGRRRGGDWMHTNSVDYDALHDLLIISSHKMSEIWVIDHSTSSAEAAGHTGGEYGKGGDLLYRWGNPEHYGAGDALDRALFNQHDARWIAGETPGELRVLVFNNGTDRPGGDHSTVDELVLPFDAKSGFARVASDAFGPDAPRWTYGAEEGNRFYCSFISGAQRLPNGNTLICAGTEGRAFEVTHAGEIVWDYLNPHGGRAKGREEDRGPAAGGPQGGGRRGAGGRGGGMPSHGLFRATRIAPDHPGLSGRTLLPE